MQKLSRESGVNNCIHGARIPTELDIEAFRRAVYKVTERHPILRTTFTTRDGKPVQRVHELPIAEYFKHYDARAWSDERLQAQLSEDGQIGATIEYNTALFDAATITRTLGHYRTLMESIVVDPEQRVAQLPMLTGAEQPQILAEWNATAAPFSDQHCVHQLVEAQARRAPEAVAVSSVGRTLSCRELNERAEHLALSLRKKGVGANVIVAIGVERSPELIIAALAVLRAGAACLSPADAERQG